MSGTGFRCIKCGRSFRIIHGIKTNDLHKLIGKSYIFMGEDYSCCGKEHLKLLYDVDRNTMIKLQAEWLKILALLAETQDISKFGA